MTHLKIEQNNGITEQVSPSVIEKLYEIVHSGNLDSSSNLMGSLNTTSTYLDYVDYLEELFTKNGVRLLIITANKLYMSFEDPAVLSVLATTYGDGAGVIISDLESVNRIRNTFVGNTDIVTFNEFRYFIGINYSNYAWGENWFSGCTNLREITIPKNVKNMVCNDGAFKNCTSLLTVTFDSPSSLERISGFAGCSNLININIPNSVLTISNSAFNKCSSLTSFDTNNVTVIEASAFRECSSLTSINLQNVTSIGEWCFQSCANLTSVTFSNNLTEIKNGGFLACTSLVIDNLSLPNLTILNNASFRGVKVKQISNLGLITNIPNQCFFECTQLTSVTLPLTVISINNEAFSGCSSLATIDLSNVTSIGERAFLGCLSLSGSLSLPNTNVGTQCFCKTGLTELNLPLYNITGNDFRESPNLKKITIGGNPTNIGNAFAYNCPNLLEVVFSGITPQYNSTSGYFELDLSNVTSVGYDAFRGCSKLFELITLNGVTAPVHLILSNCTSIFRAAFLNCKLSAVTLGAFTNTDDNSQFFGCSNLEYADITRCTKILSNLFRDCTKLQTVLISNSLTTIGGSAFLGCTSLTSFTIPASVTSMGVAVFSQCSNLQYLIFEGSTPPSTLGSYGWPNIPVYVPNDSVQAYLTAFAAATGEAIKNNILPISNYNPTS